MKPEYCRDLNHNYMILPGAEGVGGEEYPVRVIAANQLPGFLECKVHRLDGQVKFYYEITSRQSLSSMAERKKLGQRQIQALLKGLVQAFEAMGDYLLDVNALLLAEQYIYMDIETEEVFFCYMPLADRSLAAALRELSEYILKNLDHQDKEAVLWGYALYSQTTQDNYSVKTALQEVHRQMAMQPEEVAQQRERPADLAEDELVPEPELPPRTSPGKPARKLSGKPGRITGRLLAGGAVLLALLCLALLLTGILDPVKTAGILFCITGIILYLAAAGRKKSSKQYREAGVELSELVEEAEEPIQPPQLTVPDKTSRGTETETAAEYGETTLLCESVAGRVPILESRQPRQNPDIELLQKSTVIGKMAGQADIIIKAAAVSRVHAKIDRFQTELFLTDLNSTNGTYLNGERLNANECRKMNAGDEVLFADNGYIVRL